MKINIGSKKRDISRDDDSIYQHYGMSKGPGVYGGISGKRRKENRWIFQLLISGVIVLAVWGLFKTNLPLSGAVKDGVRYLMTTETNMQPVFAKVVQLAAQVGNVEWPLVDDVPQPVNTAVTAPEGPVLLLPVSGNVLGTYGWQTDPEEGVQVFHEGIDISAPVGTDVKCAAGGKVAGTGGKAGQGKYVLVNIAGGETVRYAHLEEVLVTEGQQLKAGDVVGKSGLSGDTGPHVHFEVIVNGRPENPLDKLDIDFTRLTPGQR